ncbi:hypothetical protein Bbelb_011720 [Branchiostoma belcheri]|nr:hypothetical protein Bbelb_011720 [Branchiostoma belcheri]
MAGEGEGGEETSEKAIWVHHHFVVWRSTGGYMKANNMWLIAALTLVGVISSPVISQSCGGTLTASSGTFHSPNYPSRYPTTRIVSMTSGYQPGTGRLDLRRVPTSGSVSVQHGFRWCGQDKPPAYLSASNSILDDHIWVCVHARHNCGNQQRLLRHARYCTFSDEDHRRDWRSPGQLAMAALHPSCTMYFVPWFFRSNNPSRWTVRLGSHTREATDSTQQDFSVSRIIMHENYNMASLDNDIALMKLSGSADVSTSYVDTVCVPDFPFASGTGCYVTGWGTTGSGSLATTLQQAYVPIIARSTCNLGSWYNGAVTNNMICAGHAMGDIDSCQRREVVPGGYRQLGYGCAQPNRPGVYTNVKNYVQWIQDKLQQYS